MGDGTLNAPIAASAILFREANNQLFDLLGDPWTSWSALMMAAILLLSIYCASAIG